MVVEEDVTWTTVVVAIGGEIPTEVIMEANVDMEVGMHHKVEVMVEDTREKIVTVEVVMAKAVNVNANVTMDVPHMKVTVTVTVINVLLVNVNQVTHVILFNTSRITIVVGTNHESEPHEITTVVGTKANAELVLVLGTDVVEVVCKLRLKEVDITQAQHPKPADRLIERPVLRITAVLQVLVVL